MATFDFNSLNRPASAKRPINPIEIFRSAPALAETPNDLWQGQSKALEIWHAGRHLRDTLISLHTGAGKSIVGLLNSAESNQRGCIEGIVCLRD